MHVGDGRAGGDTLQWPLSLRGWPDHAGDPAHRQHRGAPSASGGGTLELQPGPAGAALAEPRHKFSLAPLRLAIFAGLAMSVLGSIGAVATIGEALFVHETPSGWASTMVVLLLVSGVQSIILGVLGEYVGRTFLSANGKPQGTCAVSSATRT